MYLCVYIYVCICVYIIDDIIKFLIKIYIIQYHLS